jgi:hypothetical protein
MVMITEARRVRTRRLRGDGDTARIRAARAAASDAGLLVNAQKDVKLFGTSIEEGRLEDVLPRALLDLGTLMTLTGRIAVPMSAMVSPTAGAHAGGVDAGREISQASYTLARSAAAEVLSTGTDKTAASVCPLRKVYRASPVGWEGQEEEAS